MRLGKAGALIVVGFAAACGFLTSTPPSTPTARPTVPLPTAAPSPLPAPTWPPVTGPQPSNRVAVFYYPWYRTPQVDTYWDHWGEGAFGPPLDIASDYYPTLGAYSIADSAILAHHFAWLREAGVGVIISSWWGQGSREDQAVALLLEVAEEYGIKVAFHIEPYHGRTADRLVEDVKYLYDRYGAAPAFFRTNASSRWSPDDRPKGLFFVWLIEFTQADGPRVEASYWQSAMDAIHSLPDGGLIIANTTQGGWVDAGHFDGLYNYATLDLERSRGFSWAQSLPPEAWYVPSVLPGFSARRIGYAADTYVPRNDGVTYDAQWEAALGLAVEPAMVTITSFNEWHEGTQIEPAAVGAENGRGYTYEDYDPLSEEGYLRQTQRWVQRFLALTWPATYRARIRVSTTSDWTTFGLVSGGTWLRPVLVSASEEAIEARLEGDRIELIQPLARAEAGGSVQVVLDVLLSDLDLDGTIVFAIERGHLGSTQVELSNFLGAEPLLVDTFIWAGIASDERNTSVVEAPAEQFLSTPP